MNDTRAYSITPLIPLLLVIFIDTMGAGILFPILEPVIVDPATSIMSVATSMATRQISYGLLLSCYMLFMFLSSPILGDFSDHLGRKKVIMFCLIATSIGYIMSAVALNQKLLWLLVLGRAVDGLSAGSQGIAQAAIIDVCDPKRKSVNLSLIVFVSSVGFVLGPLFGGILSNPHLVSWFNFQTPLYFAAVLSLFNILLLQKGFKETFNPPDRRLILKFTRAIELFTQAFTTASIRRLSYVFMFSEMAFGIYILYIAVFLFRRYNIHAQELSLFMSFLAVGFAVGSSILIRILTKFFKPTQIVIMGASVCAIGYWLTFGVHQLWAPWVSTFFISAASAVLFASIMELFSNQVDENHQGWVMGIVGALTALSMGLGGLGGNIIGAINIDLPLMFASLCSVLALIFMVTASKSIRAR